MAKQIEAVAQAELVEGGQTTLHSHPGGGEAFPVGSIFLSVVATNPATLLGYGTWSQLAQGQFLVGQKATDPDFDTPEETGGAKTHTHTDHPPLAHSGGAVEAIAASTDAFVKGGTTAAVKVAADIHTHPAPSFTQPSQHDAQSHNSPSHIPPYYVVYVWKRVS